MPLYMQIATISVDLLKQIAWPVAAVVIASLFRGELRALLPKLRRVGPSGLEFDVEQQQLRAAVVTAPGELKELPGLSRTPAMANVERVLHERLRQSKQEDREALLVRLLAQSHLETYFEQTYRLIFGSQITALKILNQGIKASEANAREHFETLKGLYPEVYKHYGYEQWLGFLLWRELVMRSDDTFQITDLGRDFLFYLTAKGLPENKPL